jgi:hypothetical protein
LQSELEREKSDRVEAQERARAATEEARKKMQAAVAEAVSIIFPN